MQFLEEIDDYYKRELFPYVEDFGHLLKVDNTDGMNEGKLHDLIDDIELLDFTKYPHVSKFENWNYNGDEDHVHWHTTMRLTVSSGKNAFMDYLYQPYYDIAGLGDVITVPEVILRENLMENHVSWLKYFLE